jgi:hypothetical protein
VVVSTFLLASGCGTFGTIKSSVREEYPTVRELVAPGVTTRADMDRLFGAPLLRADAWRVEVYRAAKGKDVTFDWAVLVPVPTRLDDFIVYGMVQYDENDVVKEAKWDQLIESSSAVLRIGDLLFISHGSRQGLPFSGTVEYLLLDGASSREALRHAPPPEKCLVTVGRHNLVSQIQIDHSAILDDSYPDRGRVFLQVALSPGQHLLTMMTPFTGWRPREFSASFSCKSGESLYAVLDIKTVPTGKTGLFANAYSNEGEVKILSEPGDHFLNVPKMLYHAGSWVADH